MNDEDIHEITDRKTDNASDIAGTNENVKDITSDGKEEIDNIENQNDSLISENINTDVDKTENLDEETVAKNTPKDSLNSENDDAIKKMTENNENSDKENGD